MTDSARHHRRARKAELALRALGQHGTPKAAADFLGIAETTLRRRVADYCELKGFQSPEHALYWIDRPRKLDEIGSIGA